MNTNKQSKKSSKKDKLDIVGTNERWIICRGNVPQRGRPPKVTSLFKVVAEKIPFEFLKSVEDSAKARGHPTNGIYLAHDSMGAVRYAGRGDIFGRLRACYRKHPLELLYFSFYVIEEKKHEREIETLVIRACSHLLEFNDRKKWPTISPGNVLDYEPGTFYYERQKKRGRRSSAKIHAPG
jgi:hypothetical protein